VNPCLSSNAELTPSFDFQGANPQPYSIAKLSPELLCEVFILCCKGSLSSISVVASVCTQWHDVVIADSRLWASKISVDVDECELWEGSNIRSPSMLLSTALRRWETFKIDFRFVATSNNREVKELSTSLFSTLLQHRYRWRSIFLSVSSLSQVSIPWRFKKDFHNLQSFTFQIPDSLKCHSDYHFHGWMYDLLSRIGYAPNLTSLKVPLFPYNLSYRRMLPSSAFSQLTHFDAQSSDFTPFVELILSAARTSLVSCRVRTFHFTDAYLLPVTILPKLEALTLPYPSSDTRDRLLSSLVIPRLKELTFCGSFRRIGGELNLISGLIMRSGCHVKRLQLPPGASMTDVEFARSELVGIHLITVLKDL
jgi:hypothetical protein